CRVDLPDDCCVGTTSGFDGRSWGPASRRHSNQISRVTSSERPEYAIGTGSSGILCSSRHTSYGIATQHGGPGLLKQCSGTCAKADYSISYERDREDATAGRADSP